ncbi:hypothetical protein Tco_0144953 [Tanacetum coccineum]
MINTFSQHKSNNASTLKIWPDDHSVGRCQLLSLGSRRWTVDGDDLPPYQVPTAVGVALGKTEVRQPECQFGWQEERAGRIPQETGSCPCTTLLGAKCRGADSGAFGKVGTQFDLRPHMESDRWPQIYAGIQQHLQKIYNGKKAALKERYWVPEEDGTYDLERLRRGRPSHISEVNWDAQLAFWNDPKNLARAAQNKQNRAKSKVDEMLRLQGLGSNTPTGVPYTEDEIMAIVRGGKQRGTFPELEGVTRDRARSNSSPSQSTATTPISSDDKFSQMLNQFESQPEYGGGSGSGGCGDDVQEMMRTGGEDEVVS